MFTPFFNTDDFALYQGDVFDVLPSIDYKFDMIFADPPYFLSNGGSTIKSGKIVSVNKGEWDNVENHESMDDFNYKWISAAYDKLSDNGTFWISGTYHNIFSIGKILSELNCKILNVITWEKNNPPPNFSRRFFTYSSELIIWVRKYDKKPHYYNYDLMKEINDSKQMKDVWKLPAVSKFETSQGKHPTQKPLSLLIRIILASTKKGDKILDPFSGSGTTGIAAALCGRKFTGIEKEPDFVNLTINRLEELNSVSAREKILKKIQGFPSNLFLENYLSEIENLPVFTSI